MLPSYHFKVLIIEPNIFLTKPYHYLPNTYTLTRISDIRRAQIELKKSLPDLILLSASYPPKNSLRYLELIKKSMGERIIPILYVVDFSAKVSSILGTTWGGKVNILSSQTTQKEFFTAMRKIL